MRGILLMIAMCLPIAPIVGPLGCASPPRHTALAMRDQVLEFRQRSTRLYQTDKEDLILSACAGVLQDLGFTIVDSETELGFILATKDRTAVEDGQVAGKVFMAILFRADVPIDKNQTFRVSIVTRPAESETAVRATFQRIVWNDRNEVSKMHPIEDVEVYQEFFDRLSKSVFLEGQQL